MVTAAIRLLLVMMTPVEVHSTLMMSWTGAVVAGLVAGAVEDTASEKRKLTSVIVIDAFLMQMLLVQSLCSELLHLVTARTMAQVFEPFDLPVLITVEI